MGLSEILHAIEMLSEPRLLSRIPSKSRPSTTRNGDRFRLSGRSAAAS